MAKVTGPLLSMSATGSVGKALTFASWKGIPYVREWFKPQNPRSPAQIIVRVRMSTAVAAWRADIPATHDFWNVMATGQALSGFNLYVKAYIAFMKANAEASPGNTNVSPMTAGA